MLKANIFIVALIFSFHALYCSEKEAVKQYEVNEYNKRIITIHKEIKNREEEPRLNAKAKPYVHTKNFKNNPGTWVRFYTKNDSKKNSSGPILKQKVGAHNQPTRGFSPAINFEFLIQLQEAQDRIRKSKEWQQKSLSFLKNLSNENN
jgi:hypothetical protein